MPPAGDDLIEPRLRQCRSLFPGNGILRGRDNGVEKARHIQPIVSRDKRPHENPPVRRHLHDTGKSLFVWDCVVADAVVIEPVSATKGLGNREKYRENPRIFTEMMVTSSSNAALMQVSGDFRGQK